MKQVAPGESGELCLCSEDFLCMEYFHLPELTAEKFIDCPFEPGKRMFRTGDKVKYNESGELMLVGRMDNMVKLRGQRIETGEVENVAQELPAIVIAVCAVKQMHGEDQLCLYYEATDTVDHAELKAQLAKRLAPYMVPSVYIQVDKLPRNERGKVNRKALPDPVIEAKVEMVAPSGGKEQLLFNIASRMMKTDQFGVTDDLFDLGMTSLMAIAMIAEAGRSGLKLRPSDIMRHRTIRATLKAQIQMCYWYDGYHPDKPILIFLHGIALTKTVLPNLVKVGVTSPWVTFGEFMYPIQIWTMTRERV